MKIIISLIVFTVDKDPLVLLRNDDIFYEEFDEESPAMFDIIDKMMKDSMNITGRWAYAIPRLVGIIDSKENHTINKERYLSIVYSLHLAAKNTINAGYSWVALKELEEFCNNDMSKNIIRYAAIGGVNV